MKKNQIVFDRVNHLHLLVKIKGNVVYKYSLETLERIAPDKIWFEDHKWETIDLDLSACVAPDNVEIVDGFVNNAVRSGDADRLGEDVDRLNDVEGLKLKNPVPYRHFAHLFNAYSRYLQIRTGRTGNLFERPFKRKIVENEEYLKQAILYIHNNPVHHGFCTHPLEYAWSSYITSISQKPTKLKRDEIIKLFNDTGNFIEQHNREINIAPIEKWLEIATSDLHKHDADRSIDAVRSEETEVGFVFDLSACVAPDNVKKGTKKEKSNE